MSYQGSHWRYESFCMALASSTHLPPFPFCYTSLVSSYKSTGIPMPTGPPHQIRSELAMTISHPNIHRFPQVRKRSKASIQAFKSLPRSLKSVWPLWRYMVCVLDHRPQHYDNHISPSFGPFLSRLDSFKRPGSPLQTSPIFV